MTYTLTEAAIEARDLRVRIRLLDIEIQRLKEECQESMDEVIAQAGEIARLKEQLAEAKRYRRAS
jgi:formiminotetrahydrofolate cyclodeaminase